MVTYIFPAFIELDWNNKPLESILRTFAVFRRNAKHNEPLNVATIQKALTANYPDGSKAPELTISKELIKYPPIGQSSEVEIYGYEIKHKGDTIGRVLMASDEEHANRIHRNNGNNGKDDGLTVNDHEGVYYTENMVMIEEQQIKAIDSSAPTFWQLNDIKYSNSIWASPSAFHASVRRFRGLVSNTKTLNRKHITETFFWWYRSPELWKRYKTNKGEIIKFDTFTEFICHPVYGVGIKPRFLEDIIKCPDTEKMLSGTAALAELAKMKDDVRRGVVASIDQAAPIGRPANNKKGDNVTFNKNTKHYYIARARRDNPEVYKQIQEGKLKTTTQIKKALGLKAASQQVSIPNTPKQAAKTLKKKYGWEWCQTLSEELKTID